MHYGTDIKMQKGDTVLAVNDGVIARAGWGYGFGNIIIVQHENNIQTYYAHLSEFLKEKGEWVAKGEPIGLAGSTGEPVALICILKCTKTGRPLTRSWFLILKK